MYQNFEPQLRSIGPGHSMKNRKDRVLISIHQAQNNRQTLISRWIFMTIGLVFFWWHGDHVTIPIIVILTILEYCIFIHHFSLWIHVFITLSKFYKVQGQIRTLLISWPPSNTPHLLPSQIRIWSGSSSQASSLRSPWNRTIRASNGTENTHKSPTSINRLRKMSTTNSNTWSILNW